MKNVLRHFLHKSGYFYCDIAKHVLAMEYYSSIAIKKRQRNSSIFYYIAFAKVIRSHILGHMSLYAYIIQYRMKISETIICYYISDAGAACEPIFYYQIEVISRETRNK